MKVDGILPRRLKVFTLDSIDKIPQLQRLSEAQLTTMKAVAAVLPFRVNEYVIDELIRWDDVPNDPMFQLTFPQPGMLDEADRLRMERLIRQGASRAALREAARPIQETLNPHPAGQLELNVPRSEDGRPLRGMQHKYRETVLFFPTPGQTCHAYCTYCFRWPQFVGMDELKFAAREAGELVAYLRKHREVTSVLLTGGDPMVMKTKVLRRYIEPLLSPDLDHITSIRIGTKAPAYWPYRFVTDDDADDLMALFQKVRDAGRSLALMAHYSHPRELEPPIAQLALRRIQDAGAIVRCQAPLIRHVNDDAGAWATLWEDQVRLGAVPYYLFVERDTGAKRYFEVPLARAHQIFRDAYTRLSGLARTVRGPSMSAEPGKILVDGVTTFAGQKVFALKLVQARNPDWVGRPFFARYDESATWLHELRPAFGEREFFFEAELRAMKSRTRRRFLPTLRARRPHGRSHNGVGQPAAPARSDDVAAADAS